VDADDFHSAENKEKMHRGLGLTDTDRGPWLDALRTYLERALSARQRTVLACSALKEQYREALTPPDAADRIRFVYLAVPSDVLHERLVERHHPFATPALLQSQLETLEEPHDAVRVDGTRPVPEIVTAIRRALGI
jgi:gluconokinase